jgi:hypothetical protein
LSITFPPLPEQQIIVRALRAVLGAREAQQREAALLDELCRALLGELMSGRLSAAALIEQSGGEP